MERLTFHANGRVYSRALTEMETLYRLAELEDKLESGELRELPKVDGTAWLLNDPYFRADIRLIIVDAIKITKNGVTIFCIYDDEYCEFRADFIFKTREQAEARLKEFRGE